MGCDLSTLGWELTPPKRIHPIESTPIEQIRGPRGASVTASVRPLTAISERPEENQDDFGDIQEEQDDDNIIVEPRLRATSCSSLSSIMENRPPSGISNASFTRVFKTRPLDRSYSIDISRAKSNGPVVSLCSKKIGIEEFVDSRSHDKPCDIYWHSHWHSDTKNFVKSSHSRVNKFPGMTELAKKISLTHAMNSMQTIFPTEYSFYPKSWFLPAHTEQFQSYFQKETARRKAIGMRDEMWFIVKPDEGAQGTGIYLINNPEKLVDCSVKQLVQEYIADPFLMADELKFDFRVYGVIKSINPLQLYVAREGMARFCTEKYQKPTTSNFENLYSHLTNYSLNKANDSYVHSNTLRDQAKGSKRLLSTVFHQLEARGFKTKRLWHDIKIILVKTVLAILPEIVLHYEHYFHEAAGPQCFQIIGFDIMLRADGTPILLEVNAAPSLSIDHVIPAPGRPFDECGPRVRSVVDEVIKIPLVKDTLLLVLGLLDEEYSARSEATLPSINKFRDDMNSLTAKRKPHLSEIFPIRYGSHSGHLLFLDKAMYIYMQFVQLRNTVQITPGGIKQFVKKCNLSDVLDPEEVEKKIFEINYYFTGDKTTATIGLPFHAFLLFMFYVAEKKFPHDVNLLAKIQRLMAYCDASLRHYGVRSARLRRTEIGNDDSSVEIYMLPGRIRAKRRSRSGEPTSVRKHEEVPSAAEGYAHRRRRISQRSAKDQMETSKPRDRNNNSNNNTLMLPKIAH